MQNIANLMGVVQGTISNWVAWAELQEVRQEIARIGVQPPLIEINYNFDTIQR